MVYTMEDHQVRSGMVELEALLKVCFPVGGLNAEGEVQEAFLASMYRDASQGDQHITFQEYKLYRQAFLAEIEGSLPDAFRVLRRRGN
jgi:hypothetical protein